MNKFERWLYVLFDKTSGLKDLIISYKEKRMDLERIRKEKEIIELELYLIEKDEKNPTEIQEKSKEINKELKTIKSLDHFKEIKSKSLLLKINTLEKIVEKIEKDCKRNNITIEKKENYKDELLKIRHNANNKDMCIMDIIKNLKECFNKLKNILKYDKKISENELLYCEKELLRLNGIEIKEKVEKKIDERKDKEVGKMEKFLRNNKTLDSIWEGLKFSKIIKRKREALQKKTTIKSSGLLYHQYLVGLLIYMTLTTVSLCISPFFRNIFEKEYIKWPLLIILIVLPLILTLYYISTNINKITILKTGIIIIQIIIGTFYFLQMIDAFKNIVSKLVNLYFIENNSEIDRIIFVIVLFILWIYLIFYIPNLINIFKIEKIFSKEISINQILRTIVLSVSVILYLCLFLNTNKNSKSNNNSNKTDFIVDTEIPNSKEAEGKIFINEEEIPIKIINGNIIKIVNENEIKEKVVVNIGNEKIKIMDCTKSDCKNIKKGEIINLKNRNFILRNEKKYEEECEKNYNSFYLVEKCYESGKWNVKGNFLKGEIFKIEDKYYTFDRSSVSAVENINYILYPVGKLFLSIIFFTVFYLLFKGNKDYYNNRKKEKEEKKNFIRSLLGEDIKNYVKEELEEEIKQMVTIFNFSIFKIFFTIPPLTTILLIIFKFIQKPEINFKINPYSAFSAMLLIISISALILLIIIGFIVQKTVELIFLPRNEFFEFTEIILEIAEENKCRNRNNKKF